MSVNVDFRRPLIALLTFASTLIAQPVTIDLDVTASKNSRNIAFVISPNNSADDCTYVYHWGKD